MGKFSQMAMGEQETEVFDHCDECGNEIYVGQKVWKSGIALFCTLRCLQDSMRIEFVKIKAK
ncbi:hypothetical protein [Brevibacillus laterosporus]|uniref:hypothetical protein n=1 Tax=Brevibacillus laterosporus TaxID=1465 RepID=UPI0018CC9286|nr:hypothetical protein [Brevibacillus laterosporus]MBG9786917.1 hypothetical protein [Brevibacillus laterosporus]